MSRRPVRGPEIAAALLAVAAFAGPALHPAPDADTWWHLRAGADMLAGRAGTFVEAWSFTAAGRPWVNHEWLAEAVLALSRQAGGDPGVVVTTAILLALTALLLLRAARLDGLPPVAAAAGLALAAAASGDRFVPRPQVFSYFCLALLLERLATARRGRGSLWVVPAIQVLWTNVHGPLEGLAIGSALVLGGAVPELPLKRRLLLCAALLAASLVHPQGYRALLFSVSLFGRGQLFRQVIQEWLPLTHPGQAALPQAPATWACLVLSALAGLAGLAIRKARRSWGNALLLLGFSAAPFMAVRHRDLMSLFLTPGIALVWSALSGERRRAPLPDPHPAAGRRAVPAAAAFGLPLLLVLAPGVGFHRYQPVWPPAPVLSETGFPRAAAQFLKTQQVGRRLFNSYDFGGFLVDHLGPPWLVFIDGRYVVYGETLVRDYLETRDGGARARQILAATGADLLLVRYPQPDGYQGLAREARGWPEWALVFWDDLCLLYLKRSGVPAAWLAAHEFRRFDPTLPPAMDDVAYWRRHQAEILTELERAAREAPEALRPLLALGLALEYNGRENEAAGTYRSILRLHPANRPAREGLLRLGAPGGGGSSPGIPGDSSGG